MRVVAMYRVSTERQAEQGASLDAQQRKFRDLAGSQQWEVVAEFRGAESATQASTERHVLQQVLECVRSERPDAIYVHEQSRLTRGDELEVALLLRELREQQVKVIVGGVIRDLGSIDDRFTLSLQGVIDRAESERIRERVSRGKREKARQGKWVCGAAPFGYSNPPKYDSKHGILQVVPQEAATVRRIFELAAAGMGGRPIAAMLNNEGIAAPKGGQWGKTSIARVLGNVVYIGTQASGVWQRPGKGKGFRLELDNPGAILVDEAHEAIISRSLWNAVRNRMRPPCTRQPRLLTGLLRLNGRPAQGDGSRGRLFYRVRGEKNSPWVSVAPTEELVWRALQEVLTQPAILEACLNDSGAREREAALREQREAAEANLKKLQARRERLLTMRLDGEISKEEFQVKRAELEAAVEASESANSELRQKINAFDPNRVRRALAAARVAIAPQRHLDGTDRRRLLSTVLAGIDAKAVHYPVKQRKGEGGRFAKGEVCRWKIEELTFSFAGGDGSGDRRMAPTSPDCARRPRRR